MLTRMAVKRTLKRTVGQTSAALAPFVPQPTESTACILVYHRVADIPFVDPRLDNWNVPPDVFDFHMAALAGSAECGRLEDLPALLASPPRRMACVTFDDGFASVCTRALPILRRYRIPATVFVVTKFVGSDRAMPFDRWSQQNAHGAPSDASRPMTWRQVEECVASGLVTIGAHSHQHLDGRLCTSAQLQEEAEESHAILKRRLGEPHTTCYAYPYGSTRLGEVPAAYVAAVRRTGYKRAVCTDLGLATSASDPFLLPRVEASSVDSPAVIRAKVRGSLAPFRLTDWLRRADRSA